MLTKTPTRDAPDSARAEIHALIHDFESLLTQSNTRKSSAGRPDPTRLRVERRLTELVNARSR